MKVTCPSMLRHIVHKNSGFTVLELLVVLAIVGILAAIAIPLYSDLRNRAKAGAAAHELRSFVTAFFAYQTEHGDFPPDSHLTLPLGMEKYIAAQIWAEETPLGGHYNWEGPDSYPYAGISIFQPTASAETIEALDELLDDGNLASGRFRTGVNGRPTFIFEE